MKLKAGHKLKTVPGGKPLTVESFDKERQLVRFVGSDKVYRLAKYWPKQLNLFT